MSKYAENIEHGTKLYLLRDGVENWISAQTPVDAVQVYIETHGGDPGLDDDLSVELLTVDRAAAARFYDEDEPDGGTASMLDEYLRNPSRRYVACSEW